MISLWARLASEKIYNRLSSTGERLSYEDPVLSPSCMHLFTNVLRVQSKDGQYDGHEWQSIEGIDLNTGLTETITMSDGIGIESSLQKTWISTLHGANADGSELYCSLAYEKR